MATIRLVPSTIDNAAGTTYIAISNTDNAYTNTDSNTYATLYNQNASTSNRYVYLRGFNFNDIPQGAIINSFSIKFKAYESGLSTSSSYRPYLVNDTTTITGSCSAITTTTTTQTFTGVTANWDTIKGYGSDFGIRFNVRRNNRNTAGYLYLYGAEIEVNYTVPVYYTVTSSTSTGTINPSGATSVLEGSDYTLTISNVNNLTVTDNNVDVTSQLVQETSGTKTLIPNGNTMSGFSSSNISNAYSDATSSTSAQLNLAGGGTIGTLYLDLGGASIPTNATILGVSCSATLQFSRNNSSSGITASFRLYTGSTAKGSSTSWITSATDVAKTTYNLTTGTWTAAEIANAKFYLTATNNASSTQRIFYVYGVSFNVTYEFDGVIYTYTITNVIGDHTVVVSAGAVVSVTGVSLDKHTDSVQEGQTTTLVATVSPSNASNKAVTWSTNNSAVATVSNGVVSGLTAGSATITVTTVDGGFTDTCVITVTSEPTTEYVMTSSLVPGKTYLVVNGNSGSVYIMSNESGGSRILKGVSATISNGKISLKNSVESKCAFTCVQYIVGNEITTTLSSNGNYLYCDNSNGLRFQSSSSLDRFWHFRENKFWQFKNSSSDGYSDASSEYKYYLQWDNSGNFTDSHVDTTSIESSTLPAVYLFIPVSQVENKIYLKRNGTWTQYSKVYKKISGAWVEQTNPGSIFDTTANYVNMDN